MAVTLEHLQALAATFSSVRAGPQQVLAGEHVLVRLVRSSLSDLHVTDVIAGALNLTWITKDVRFESATLQPELTGDGVDLAVVDSLLEGGMPARLPVLGTLGGTELLDGTPGQIAQLVGSFPVAVDVPVAVSVRWGVFRKELVPEGFDPFVPADPASFLALGDLTSLETAFLFLPQTVEWTNTLIVPVRHFFIGATVTLQAGGVTHTFSPPKVPIDIPAVPIPTVAAFFLHKNFAPHNGNDEGACLVVVPNNSPLRSAAALQDALDTLDGVVSRLTFVVDLAVFLVGLRELAGALTAQPHLQFRVANNANELGNFSTVTLIKGPLGFLFGVTDTQAEDSLSSLIFLGHEGKVVECYNDRNHQALPEGHFDVRAGPEHCVLIRDLHKAAPVGEPAGAVVDVKDPPEGGFNNPETFGNELSSLRFA